MKLFEKFEAVRFPEENLILVTSSTFLYYIYNLESQKWQKHKNAGYDRITVKNYPDVTKKELMETMGGIFPTKETDFLRLCYPSELCISDMFQLLAEEFPEYISDYVIHNTADVFLLESNKRYKSYEKLWDLFEQATANKLSSDNVVEEIKKLSLSVIGRDIYKREIGIEDGHNSLSYFWIMPVRIIDYDDTNDMNCVAEMSSNEISIEERNLDKYLAPFLYKYFDGSLEANKMRIERTWTDEDGNIQVSYCKDFEWYLTYNFYTFDSILKILTDIRNTIEDLIQGRENEYTNELEIKKRVATKEELNNKGLTEEQIKEYYDYISKENETMVSLVIDFYQRFLYRMEYMLKIGKEKGYDLISFMGP